VSIKIVPLQFRDTARCRAQLSERNFLLELARQSAIIRAMPSREYVVGPDEANALLQDFLAGRLALSRNRAKQMLDARNVFVNGRRVWMARHVLRRGDVVETVIGQLDERRVAPAILYQDEHVLVVNKPPGRLAAGADSLEEELRGLLGLPSLAAAHRLDRDTSGCFLLAKSRAALDAVVGVFQDQRVLKVYHALALGHMPRGEQTITKAIENQKAVTHLRVLDSNRIATHLAVKIETGRTHQIRKHLLTIGHPVLGERAYGTNAPVPPEARSVARQMLHARRLEFQSPLSSVRIRCEAPLPADFMACLRRLGLR
jgi:23S rRNA pseudouridine1911/1915/1917 synthase